MKKLILIVLVVGMFGWAIYEFVGSDDEGDDSASDTEESSDQVGLGKGDIAPDFELKTLDGETVRLSDYRGERVFVNFWATWCPPCRAEIPDLLKLYENKDVEILAVDLTNTEQSEEDVIEFTEDFEMNTFPVLMDVDADVAVEYQVQAYPTTYMVDSNGRIQFSAMGAMNYDFMVQELEKME